MRQLAVYVNDLRAGTLKERVAGKDYEFAYDKDYLLTSFPPISVTLPKRIESYESEHLFPFFSNLLPEGAIRKVVCREKRIDEQDFFGMLMATVGTDIIGSVNFKEIEREEG